jgi:hypothetical protein
MIVGEHGEHNVPTRGFAWIGSSAGALLEKWRGFVGGAVIDRKVVSCLEQVYRHG